MSSEIRDPAVTAIHRERIIQKIIIHLHFLAFRVKQLEAHDIGSVILKLDLDLIGSRRIGKYRIDLMGAVHLEGTFLLGFPSQLQHLGRRGAAQVRLPVFRIKNQVARNRIRTPVLQGRHVIRVFPIAHPSQGDLPVLRGVTPSYRSVMILAVIHPFGQGGDSFTNCFPSNVPTKYWVAEPPNGPPGLILQIKTHFFNSVPFTGSSISPGIPNAACAPCPSPKLLSYVQSFKFGESPGGKKKFFGGVFKKTPNFSRHFGGSVRCQADRGLRHHPHCPQTGGASGAGSGLAEQHHHGGVSPGRVPSPPGAAPY